MIKWIKKLYNKVKSNYRYKKKMKVYLEKNFSLVKLLDQGGVQVSTQPSQILENFLAQILMGTLVLVVV